MSDKLGSSPTYRILAPTLGRAIHRHANQIRRRYPIELDDNDQVEENDQTQAQNPPHSPIAHKPQTNRQQTPAAEPVHLRRSGRARQAPQRLNMNPTKPKYGLIRS
ncbi:hypothetical protein niasHT_011436 [Heterodera trifolii]|uniref:Uncharacterized protein n=1 Tax=Heterodera trifolii TaxID=157864 RepID=A0ABD2L133_9BILA